MRNIIIVECISTGINFIEDIINRGYNPIVLECKGFNSEIGEKYNNNVHKDYEDIPYDFDIIYEQDTYEETLEEVKKYDPVLVLPGIERGVYLACKLSNDLNLQCNPIENLDAMTLKHEMQNKIAEYGIRSIRGKVVDTLEDAVEFYDSEELEEVVLKPIYSSGSASVRICSDREEMIEHFKELMDKTNRFGENINKLLVQERIVGEEYIVNTVSCEGIHRVTLVWKYNKVKTSDGAIIYDTCETVNELDIGEAEMVEYAYEVADALGIKYGPVHGEYMLDEKGPVLIEVNCRPCGGHMPAKFLNKISGQHETDSILDSYLNPERFKEKQKQKYELYAYGALKFFITPKDLVAIASPMRDISIKLESHFKTNLDNIDEDEKKTYFKTEDVGTSCGIVYMVNKDHTILERDIEYLRNVEKRAFSLILTEETENENEDIFDLDEIKHLINTSDKYGTGILITNHIMKDCNILQISPDQIKNVGAEFDFVIINLNKTITENDPNTLVKLLLDSFLKIKEGGLILIPKSTYNMFTSGRKGMEALIKALNFKIELPPYGVKDTIVASRR